MKSYITKAINYSKKGFIYLLTSVLIASCMTTSATPEPRISPQTPIVLQATATQTYEVVITPSPIPTLTTEQNLQLELDQLQKDIFSFDDWYTKNYKTPEETRALLEQINENERSAYVLDYFDKTLVLEQLNRMNKFTQKDNFYVVKPETLPRYILLTTEGFTVNGSFVHDNGSIYFDLRNAEESNSFLKMIRQETTEQVATMEDTVEAILEWQIKNVYQEMYGEAPDFAPIEVQENYLIEIVIYNRKTEEKVASLWTESPSYYSDSINAQLAFDLDNIISRYPENGWDINIYKGQAITPSWINLYYFPHFAETSVHEIHHILADGYPVGERVNVNSVTINETSIEIMTIPITRRLFEKYYPGELLLADFLHPPFVDENGLPLKPSLEKDDTIPAWMAEIDATYGKSEIGHDVHDLASCLGNVKEFWDIIKWINSETGLENSLIEYGCYINP